MRRFVLLAWIALSTPPAAVAQETADAMLPLWRDANSACRSGSGDAPETRAACARRDHFTNRLSRLGLCYGRKGEVSAQYDWHDCGPDSNRLGR